MTEFGALAEAELAERVVQAAGAARVDRARGEVERHATRVLANALVNTARRNGPVENIHAGRFRELPLDQRRATPAEEREMMEFASQRLASGMTVCLRLALEQPPRPWPEQVLPYALAEMLAITPPNWSLTEASREVRLPAARES